MDIISNKEEMIFKNERDGKVSYSIGMAKRKEDGTWERGYFPVRFRKDVVLGEKTKIKIKNAWLDFFKIEKKTLPYIFINEFEEIKEQPKEEIKEEPKAVDNWSSPKDIEPDDLPFY